MIDFCHWQSQEKLMLSVVHRITGTPPKSATFCGILLEMSERSQAILALKCPVCFQGKTFRRGISMRESCSVCGIRFEREQGYFMGAMYVAHALSMPLMVAFTLLACLFGAGTLSRSLLFGSILFLPFAPAVFRYSRVIWMHLDQVLDPRSKAASD